MKMKQIFFVFLMLAAYAANAQWPNNPNKIVLGRQTTGDGLVFRGSGFPSYTPTTNKNAYVYADTTNSRVYVHIGTWLQVYPDAGDNDRDSTNEVQSIDSLYLSGNILRLKLEGSAGMGLDLSVLNTAETDPVWLAEKGQYVTIASTANWDKDVTNEIQDIDSLYLIGDSLRLKLEGSAGRGVNLNPLRDTMADLQAFTSGRLSNLVSPLTRDSVIQVYWGGTSVTSISTEVGFFNWLRKKYGDSGNREFRFSSIGGGSTLPWPSNSETPQAGDWFRQQYPGRNFRRLVGTSTSIPIELTGLGKRVVFTYSTEVGGGSFDITVNGVTRTINCNAAQSVNNEEVWNFDSIVPIDVLINNVVGGDVYLEHIRFLQNKPGVEILYGAMGGSSLHAKNTIVGSYPAWERQPIAYVPGVGIAGEFKKRTENYKPQIMIMCWTVNDVAPGQFGYDNYYKPTLDSVIKWNDSLRVQTLFIPEPGGHTAIPAISSINADSYNRMVRLMFYYAKTKDYVSVLPWANVIQEGYDLTKDLDVLKYQRKYYNAAYDTITHTYTGDFIHPNFEAYNILGDMLKKYFLLDVVDPWNWILTEQEKLVLESQGNKKIGEAYSLYSRGTGYTEDLYETSDCNLWPFINNIVDTTAAKEYTFGNFYGFQNPVSKPFDTVTLVMLVRGNLSVQLRNLSNSIFLPIIEKGFVIPTTGSIVSTSTEKGIRYYYLTFVLDSDGRAGIVINGTLSGGWLTKGKLKRITNNNTCWDTIPFQLTYESTPAIPVPGFARNAIDTTVKGLYWSPTLESATATEFEVNTSYRFYNRSSFTPGIIHNSNPNRFKIQAANTTLQADSTYSVFFKAAVIDTVTGFVVAPVNYRIYTYNGFTNTTEYYNPVLQTWSTTPVSQNYQQARIDGATYTTFDMNPNYVPNASYQLWVEFQANPYLTLVSSIYVCRGDSLYIPNAASVLYPDLDVDSKDDRRRIFLAKKPIGNATVAAPIFQCDLTLQAGTAYTEPNSLIFIKLQSDRGYRTGTIDYQFSRSNFQDLTDGTFFKISPTQIDYFPGGISVGNGAHGLFIKKNGSTFRFWVLAQEDNMFISVYTDNENIPISANTESSYTVTGSESLLNNRFANFNDHIVFEKNGQLNASYTGSVVLDYNESANGGSFIYKDGATVKRLPGLPNATPTTGHVVYWDGSTWGTKADATGGSGTVTSVAATAGAGISVTGSPITSSGTLTITNTGDTDASDDRRRIFLAKKPIGNATVAAPIFQCDLTLQAGTAYTSPNSLIFIKLQSDRGYRTGTIDYQFSRSNFQDLTDGTFFKISPTKIDYFPGGRSVGEGGYGLFIKKNGTTFRFWVLAQEDNMFVSVYTDNENIPISANTESSYTVTGSESLLNNRFANFNDHIVFEKNGQLSVSYTGSVVLDYNESANGGSFIYKDGATIKRIPGLPNTTPTTGHIVYWDGSTWGTKADATGGSGTVTSVAATAGAGISVTGSPITSSGTLTITNTGDTDASNDLTTSTVWGGDLGGSGASPQVTKIRGVTVNGGFPSTGQVLGYNGSQWIGTTISTLPALSNNTLLLSNGSGQVVTDPDFITWGVDDYFLTVNGSITGTSFRDESLNTTSASTLGSWSSTGVLTSTTVGNGLTLTQNPNLLAVNRLSSLSFLDFPSTSANSVSSVTLTITGAALGDVVSVGAPNSIPAGVVYFGYVSASNTVTLRMHNGSGGTVDPADDAFRVYVWK